MWTGRKKENYREARKEKQDARNEKKRRKSKDGWQAMENHIVSLMSRHQNHAAPVMSCPQNHAAPLMSPYQNHAAWENMRKQRWAVDSSTCVNWMLKLVLHET